MSDIPNSESLELVGGKVGVLLLHGFTGSPVSLIPWAHQLHRAGFTVALPRLPGHGRTSGDLKGKRWADWYGAADDALTELRKKCDRVFVGGFSMGGSIAARLAEIRGSEIEGLIVINTPVHDRRWFIPLTGIISIFMPELPSRHSDVAQPNPPHHSYGHIPMRAFNSLRKAWKIIERDLYLIDLPVMIGYSINDHVVDPENSETIIDNISSIDIREVIFEKSFHNVSLDYESEQLGEESITFMRDVLSGELERGALPEYNQGYGDQNDEAQLIDAEFQSIVSGLSLDGAHPTTYLDELAGFAESEKVQYRQLPLTPAQFNTAQRAALIAVLGGPIYCLIYGFTGLDFFGFGIWPGLLALTAGVATFFYQMHDDDIDISGGSAEPDDGAVI